MESTVQASRGIELAVKQTFSELVLGILRDYDEKMARLESQVEQIKREHAAAIDALLPIQ